MDTRDELPGSDNSGPHRTRRFQPPGFSRQLGGHDAAPNLAKWNTSGSVRLILYFQADPGLQRCPHSVEWRLDWPRGSDHGDLVNQQLSNLYDQELFGAARGASNRDRDEKRQR